MLIKVVVMMVVMVVTVRYGRHSDGGIQSGAAVRGYAGATQ